MSDRFKAPPKGSDNDFRMAVNSRVQRSDVPNDNREVESSGQVRRILGQHAQQKEILRLRRQREIMELLQPKMPTISKSRSSSRTSSKTSAGICLVLPSHTYWDCSALEQIIDNVSVPIIGICIENDSGITIPM
jgi:hypothetical protein